MRTANALKPGRPWLFSLSELHHSYCKMFAIRIRGKKKKKKHIKQPHCSDPQKKKKRNPPATQFQFLLPKRFLPIHDLIRALISQRRRQQGMTSPFIRQGSWDPVMSASWQNHKLSFWGANKSSRLAFLTGSLGFSGLWPRTVQCWSPVQATW